MQSWLGVSADAIAALSAGFGASGMNRLARDRKHKTMLEEMLFPQLYEYPRLLMYEGVLISMDRVIGHHGQEMYDRPVDTGRSL